MGRYAARTEFVEVVLNGRYHGVYVLMERPKLDDGRVDLDGKGVTGDYLLEMTFDFQAPRQGVFFLGPRSRKPIVYDDPERADLSRREASYIRGYVGRLERALYGRRFRSPTRGWRRYLDEPAAVDFALLNELFKNQDAFRASTFMAKGAGAKLTLGPIWDLDISMGNSNYGASRFQGGSMLSGRPWARRLYRDQAFVATMAARWSDLRARGLREHLLDTVRTTARRLGGPQRRNFRRWPVLGRYVWPNPVDPQTGRVRPTYRAEVDFLEAWLSRRVAWLDRNVARLR
jgi:hypothetical protein